MKNWLRWVYLTTMTLNSFLEIVLKKKWRNDMMIKLYAMDIFEGKLKFKELPFSNTIKNKIKAYLAKMVEDEELLAELTKED